MNPQDDFLKRLLATFRVEAEEHLRGMSAGLLRLEKTPAAEAQMPLIEAIFREAHSLKGAARSVNLTEVEAICQPLESVFAALKRRDIGPSTALFDLLHQALDSLSNHLSSPGSEQPVSEKTRARDLIQWLDVASKGALPPSGPEEQERPSVPEAKTLLSSEIAAAPLPPSVERTAPAETVRIPASRLDALLLQVEELISAKLTASHRAAELRETHAALAAWKAGWAKVRPEARALQQALDRNGGPLPAGPEKMAKLLDFLEWTGDHIGAVEDRLGALATADAGEARSLGGRVDALLQDTKKVLMLPFSSLLEVFPKVVRDLARDRGKEVDLVIQGGDLEVDRRILEEMKDPLLHLVRNGIDHGIEKSEERERRGKPPRGTLTIAVSPRNGDRVEVLVADDGAGIDTAQVRDAALKIGAVPEEEAEQMGEQDALSLVFHSGVSTSPILTDISGRGLGLTIVREKAEKLGGAVSIETHSGVGTTFRIVLPLTLATFRGVLVRAGDHLCVLPTTHMERATRVVREAIRTVENRETLSLDGRVLSLVRLSDVLELPRTRTVDDPQDTVYVVVLGAAEKRIAFLVDEVLGEQEVLVKSLRKPLSRVRNVAGATLLGAGKIASVLNVPDLMKSAVRASGTSAEPTAASATQEEGRRKSILVAEDSITSRTLLRGILEGAGYDVKTAVDGADAFMQLRSGAFDLLVSDVDMPRMSGFDLAARVRNDKKLADLPLVLVTALESREDRERGIDVGANAYIVKSSFDQSNLLEVIRRLI